jgi:1-acyl-sn-glycerol-3-phosphate acyltransferase
MAYQIMITALIILLILAGLVVLWIWRTMRRTHHTLAQVGWYFVNRSVNKILWRTTVRGSLPVGNQQGAVIVCNHRSGIDPLLIQMSTERVVHWMVAGEYFHYRLMAAVFNALGSIPVGRRGVDTAATKQAIRLAKEGKLVGLFPEGRINTSEDFLLPGRPGAAMIALKAGVPVIPCYVEGAPYNGSALGPFLMTAHAKVTIGQPIDLSSYAGRESDREVLAELTRQFLKEIAHLAGNDSFEPQLAGKRWHPSDDDSPENAAGDDDSETDNLSAPAQAKNGSAAQSGSAPGGDDEPRKAAVEG